jgi:hypothetical protein
MAQILLVSAKKIKNFTEVNFNTDETLLLSSIQVAQSIGLQTLLGTRFLNHIEQAAANNTLTTAEQTLLDDYIQPYLLWQAVYEAFPTLYARVMNKAIIVGNTEQGSAVDLKTMQYLRQLHTDRAQFYSQRMMDYIINHQQDYPLYFQYRSTDGMPPQQEVYYNGLHFEPGIRILPKVGTGVSRGGLRGYWERTGPNGWCCGDYYSY